MLFFLAMFAFAGDCSKNVIKLSLAADTTHVTYRIGDADVASYTKEHHFETLEDSPLQISMGSGDWCYDFGSLKPFGAVLGTGGVVVTVGEKREFRLRTDYTGFQVGGLSLGDVVRIEFIEPKPLTVPNECTREVRTTGLLVNGENIPITTYDCDVGRTRWMVVEERRFTVTAADASN